MKTSFPLAIAALTLSVTSALSGPPSLPLDESTPDQGLGGASITLDAEGDDGSASAGNDVGGLSVDIVSGEVTMSAGKK